MKRQLLKEREYRDDLTKELSAKISLVALRGISCSYWLYVRTGLSVTSHIENDSLPPPTKWAQFSCLFFFVFNITDAAILEPDVVSKHWLVQVGLTMFEQWIDSGQSVVSLLELALAQRHRQPLCPLREVDTFRRAKFGLFKKKKKAYQRCRWADLIVDAQTLSYYFLHRDA